MEKGKKSKNLKEKVLFLMCLGALAGNMSTEVYAQQNPENNYTGLIEKNMITMNIHRRIKMEK
mgnify:CR=1 FL=1